MVIVMQLKFGTEQSASITFLISVICSTDFDWKVCKNEVNRIISALLEPWRIVVSKRIFLYFTIEDVFQFLEFQLSVRDWVFPYGILQLTLMSHCLCTTFTMMSIIMYFESMPPSVQELVTKIVVAFSIALFWHVWTSWSRHAVSQAPPVQSPDEIPTDLRLVETTTERAQSKPVAHQIPSPESLQPKRTKVVATTRDPARRSTTSSSSGGERSLAERHQSIPSNHFSASATADHPGLDSFWRWWDIEASLFRVYCRGRKDGVPVVPPYNPSSRRGLVKVNLQVTNRTSTEIDVFWVDYKGKEVNKGSIRANSGQWYQTTWIEHPWVFRRRPDGQILLHYIPYRIIPTTSNAPTVDPDDPRVGIHRFTIQNETVDSPFWCHVDDPILPYPAKDMLTNFDKAVACTLEHCQRMGVMSLHILRKYLSNIIQNPEESKYRRIRIANTTFSQNVWLTPARGLLLAAGFVENQGSAELGSAEPLRRERVQEVSRLVYYLERWQEETSADGDAANSPQPLGADGFGRAGYGRVG